MSSDRARRLLGAVLVLVLAAGLLEAAPSEEALFRQVKVDVFDRNWQAVLRGCEEILARYPGGAAASHAAFYRATALSRIPGSEPEAAPAFRRFLEAYPGEKVLAEEAWASLISISCAPRGRSTAGCAALLREGLAGPSRYVSTLAAIRASDVQDDDLRRLALPALKRSYADQTDPEIRDEILIAILKIDPKQVPSPGPAGPTPPRPPVAGKKKPPTLIRMTVFNKAEKRYEIRFNLPLAFARMLLEAIDETHRQELRKEARSKGFDLEEIFEEIEKQGAGKLFELDDEKSRIEIWIE
jgi:hypothetical protein